MSLPIHECARCAKPVKAELVEGPDFSYFWFICKNLKCKLKWAALKKPEPEATSGQPGA